MAVGIDLGIDPDFAYNKKMFDEKRLGRPTSWMDLADPKFKDKVVFQSASASSFGLHAFLMFNRIQGGTEANVEPGFTKFRDYHRQERHRVHPELGESPRWCRPARPRSSRWPDRRLDPEGQGRSCRIRPAQGRFGRADGGAMRHREQFRDPSSPAPPFLLSADAQSKALAAGNIVPSKHTKAKATTPRPRKLRDLPRLHEDRRGAGLGRDQRQAPGVEQPLEQDDRAVSCARSR